MNYYTLRICGFIRQLPIIKIGPRYSIASFSLLGDIELVEVIARELVERIKYLDFDFLVGPEIKVLPLVYQMSNLLGHKNYIIARQKILGYMISPIKSDGRKPLVLNGKDAKVLHHKKVVLVGDVVSTGKTTKEMENLMAKVEAQILAVACVLKQGELQVRIDKPLFYLQTLPLFNIGVHNK
jgi:adenine phosphoribosyltransferase